MNLMKFFERFTSNLLTDSEFNELSENIRSMITEENYIEYKKAFEKFCLYCHIDPTGVIIIKYRLRDNQIYIKYLRNTRLVKLPEGTKLYHFSKIDNMTELIPQFRGKKERGYLYDKKRIYFTIRKEMLKIFADYKITDKIHKYLCKKDISEVYIDPFVKPKILGAVYIESDIPIPVEEIY